MESIYCTYGSDYRNHSQFRPMVVGVIVGTYSSIYVASPILLEWQDK